MRLVMVTTPVTRARTRGPLRCKINNNNNN